MNTTTTASSNTPSTTMMGLVFTLAGFAVFSAHDALVKSLSGYSVFQTIFFAMLFGYLPFSMARVVDGRAVSLRPRHPGLVFLRALAMVGSLCFAFMAFSMLPLVQAYVLLFTTPLLISLMAIPVLGEKVGMWRWSMIVLGLVGVLVVLRPSPERLELGHLLGLLAACCGAAAAVISRKIGNLENSATLILVPLIMNIVVSGGMLYFVYQPMPLHDLSIMFLIGGMALLGQLLVLNGYRRAPAAMVAPMQYSQLLWAILYGLLFFNEVADGMVLLGAAITVLSGILIVWREGKVSSQQPVLRTRNTRMVGGAAVPGAEVDEVDNAFQP